MAPFDRKSQARKQPSDPKNQAPWPLPLSLPSASPTAQLHTMD